MTFAKCGYYKEVVAKLAEEYESQEDECIKDALLRDIVSRTYYTIFLLCRDKFLEQGIITLEQLHGSDSHKELIKNFPPELQGLKNQIDQLRIFRQQADYNTNSPLSLPLRGRKGKHSIVLRSPQDFYQRLEMFFRYCSLTSFLKQKNSNNIQTDPKKKV